MTITERGITVKIYRENNNGHESYTVAWHGAGGRNRKRVATLADAKREAQIAITAIANGHSKVLSLQDDDRLQYVAALKALEGTGVELKTAVEQFAHAHGLLGGSAEIAEAVRFYMKRHGTVQKKTVALIVDEFLEERAQRSAMYQKDLKMRLERFSKDFPILIGNVTTQEISKWLRDLKLGNRSVLNYRRALVTLFRYSVERGYLPEGVTQAEKVARVKVDDEGEIGIFTPDELKRLLETSGNDVMPYLALGAFAGIRTAEIVRLDWSEINFDNGYIEIKKAKAKTKGRRLIKMQPNLIVWLGLVSQATGPVVSIVRPDYTAAEVLAPKCDPAVTWRRNGLRHSFCSYRMAILQNEHQVSSEMGNSPTMVYANYRELVTKEAAEEWFAILPSEERKSTKK